MSATLYRKYRPQTFSEVIGQKHVVRTLQNAVKSGRIGQAYLFAGPRGTGKTSIARIFAKTINCADLKHGEPCLKCNSCKTIRDSRALDIIEIDAASHTGVDNIRELRETVKLPPSALKYKAYIIDEVHMLSGGAWNALLKTLEEPPSHVVFILATTEVHKIPETILSRVQRFDFTRLTISEIIKRLEKIAKLEKVSVNREALEIIAAHSEGGMRNAESTLGQIIALEDKKITTKEVEFLIGTVSEKELADFADLVIARNIPAAFSKISSLREAGVDFKNFGKSLLNYLRQVLILKINPELGKKLSYELTKERLEKIKRQTENIASEEVLALISSLQENIEKFRNSPISQLYLEVSLAKMVAKKGSISPAEPVKPKTETISEKKEFIAKNDGERGQTSMKKYHEPGNSKDFDLIASHWSDITESLKDYNHSLSSVLKMSQPVLIDGKNLILKTKYSFYKDKVAELQHRMAVEDAIDKSAGVRVKIKVLTEKELAEQYPDFKEKKSLLEQAADIFGGKIVKE